MKKYWLAIVGVLLLAVVVFAFTRPGMRILARLTISYYDFRVSNESFKKIPFDPDAFPILDEKRATHAKELISRLGKIDPSHSIIVELSGMGPGVVPLLVEAAQQGNAPTRYQSALALGLIRDPGSLGPLVATLGDGKDRVRMAAAIALGNLGDKRAKPFLVKCLKVNNKWARFAAAKALVHMRSTTGVIALEELSNDPDFDKEARDLIAEHWKGNGNPAPLIDEAEPVPLCIRRIRRD